MSSKSFFWIDETNLNHEWHGVCEMFRLSMVLSFSTEIESGEPNSLIHIKGAFSCGDSWD